jgi:ankyrin repeat protein
MKSRKFLIMFLMLFAFPVFFNLTANANELISAAENGQTEKVRELINKKANLNLQNEHGKTALIWAALKGHMEIAELLIKKGAKLDLQDNIGNTALMWAVYYGHTEIAELLIKKGAKLDLQDKDGKTISYWARKKGYTKIAEMLENPDNRKSTLIKKAKTNNTNTSLIIAAKNGQIKKVKELINAGTDLNRKGKYNRTALMWAIYYGHTEIAELLIKKGANLDLQDEGNNTTLISAAYKGHTEIVELLINRKAKLDLQDNNGNTALMWAACEGNKKMVELLIKKGADLNLQNGDGNTALILSIDFPEIAKLLINAGADLNLQNKKGNTVLFWAAYKGNKEIVELLIKKGADLNLKNKKGDTALKWAKYKNHKEIIEILKNPDDYRFPLIRAVKTNNKIEFDKEIKKDPYKTINAADKNGKTALHWAEENNNPYMKFKLVNNGAIPTIKDKKGKSSIFLALLKGDERTVLHYIKTYAFNIFWKDKDNNTILHWAAKHGFPETISISLKKGVDINSLNNKGYTPLMMAALSHKINAIKLLISNCADVNKTGLKNGFTAIDFAIRYENLDIFTLHYDTTNSKKNSKTHQEIILLLLIHGAQLKYKNKIPFKSETIKKLMALQFREYMNSGNYKAAAMMTHYIKFSAFEKDYHLKKYHELLKGINCDAKYEHPLIDIKLYLTQLNGNLTTQLIEAVNEGNENETKRLLAEGAEVLVPYIDKFGKLTPFDIAYGKGDGYLMKTLLIHGAQPRKEHAIPWSRKEIQRLMYNKLIEYMDAGKYKAAVNILKHLKLNFSDKNWLLDKYSYVLNDTSNNDMLLLIKKTLIGRIDEI